MSVFRLVLRAECEVKRGAAAPSAVAAKLVSDLLLAGWQVQVETTVTPAPAPAEGEALVRNYNDSVIGLANDSSAD
jgi:hypothetical protein